MSEHRHRYVESALVPSMQICMNVRFGTCDAPQRRTPDPVPPPAQEHSPTSKAAARSQRPTHMHRDRLLVFNALKGAGLQGMTDEELQTATGLGGSTQRPRRIELVREGLVVDSGRVRATKSGRNAVVWCLYDAMYGGEAVPLLSESVASWQAEER